MCIEVHGAEPEEETPTSTADPAGLAATISAIKAASVALPATAGTAPSAALPTTLCSLRPPSKELYSKKGRRFTATERKKF